jgi:hypothetical protein
MKTSALLRRTSCCILVAALLLATAPRLPAPISEIESPTPTPQQSAKPRPKPSLRPKAQTDRERVCHGLRQTIGNEAKPLHRHLGRHDAGSSVGGTATQMVVDPTETSITVQDSRSRYVSEKTQRDGDTLQGFYAAGLVKWTWSLTPNSDGKTAQVRFQEIMNDQTAVFRRVAE